METTIIYIYTIFIINYKIYEVEFNLITLINISKRAANLFYFELITIYL